jgi:uncharacterized protein (DUF427 family)
METTTGQPARRTPDESEADMPDRAVLTPGPDHPIAIERTGNRVRVTSEGRIVADTLAALTLQEAEYPPVQYIPLADVDSTVLEPSHSATYCPYKGDAAYYGLKREDGSVAEDKVWTYANPYPAVAEIKDHVAFYPDVVEIEVDQV